MWPHDVAKVAAIKEALKDVDSVCRRCILRLAGVKNSREHMTKDTKGDETKDTKADDGSEESAASENLPQASKRARLTPCRTCLGVLQDDIMLPEMDKVGNDARECGYDADHFTVALSLPISMALRGEIHQPLLRVDS
jgi:hypothetical protein